MIIDKENNRILIEPRDINYILPAYVRQYLFHTRNQKLEAIVFPMFESVPHPVDYTAVPIEWIASTDPVAISIIEDGKDVGEVTADVEAEIDRLEDQVKEAKAALESIGGEEDGMGSQLQTEIATSESAAIDDSKAAPPKSKAKLASERMAARQPKMPPGGDIGAGSPSDLSARDVRLEKQIRQDLRDEPTVSEAEEKEY